MKRRLPASGATCTNLRSSSPCSRAVSSSSRGNGSHSDQWPVPAFALWTWTSAVASWRASCSWTIVCASDTSNSADVASKPLPFGTTRQYRSPMYSAP